MQGSEEAVSHRKGAYPDHPGGPSSPPQQMAPSTSTSSYVDQQHPSVVIKVVNPQQATSNSQHNLNKNCDIALGPAQTGSIAPKNKQTSPPPPAGDTSNISVKSPATTSVTSTPVSNGNVPATTTVAEDSQQYYNHSIQGAWPPADGQSSDDQETGECETEPTNR